MTRIGLLSDTHGFLDDRLFKFFSDVDEIWHAGDIGSIEVLDKLKEFRPTRAVYGNADCYDIRREVAPGPRFVYDENASGNGKSLAPTLPDSFAHFSVEGVSVLMTHIGGRPGKYTTPARKELTRLRPDIFVAGHTHILRVIYDKDFNCLHMNPGACGHYGIHSKRTALKFVIDGKEIKDMQIIELDPDK
ncbi:MAG: metallophosphoesterase family protein [Marinilabiliaceae bacterium]